MSKKSIVKMKTVDDDLFIVSTMRLLKNPFFQSMTLVQGEETRLWICFDPTCFHGQLSQVVDQVTWCFFFFFKWEKYLLHSTL